LGPFEFTDVSEFVALISSLSATSFYLLKAKFEVKLNYLKEKFGVLEREE